MAIVIINPQFGGSETGKIKNDFIEKNFNLDISKIIYNKLKDLGIDTFLVRNNDTTISLQERLNIINNLIKPNEKNILISTGVSTGGQSGAEIIYSLKNDDALANSITNEIELLGYDVLKYYQLRNTINTNEDFYPIIREVNNIESIIVDLGYIDNSYDLNYINNNIDKLGIAVANGIYNYIKKENIYVVLKDDTLYSIARKFNTSVDKIKELNNLTSNTLNVGQTLIIPKKQDLIIAPSEYITYVVKSGDTLYKIANNFNTTPSAIMNINNLTSTNLSLNQVLKIPTVKEEEIIDYNTYTVKSGDSLYKLANSFNTTVEKIKDLNNLTNNNLSIGQVLKIPTTSSNNYITYKVKSGDSLYKLANLYNTTVQDIKDLNNLTSNNLSINQVLKIPTKQQEEVINYINYVVKSGDSLYKLANLYNTTVQDIKDLNNLTSNNLSINQVLKIRKK